MNLPVITPTADDIKPCDGLHEKFYSTREADHAEARIWCKGNKKLEVKPCPFIGWCHKEREAFQETEYRAGLHGTWAGELWIDGRKVKRPGGKKNRAAA